MPHGRIPTGNRAKAQSRVAGLTVLDASVIIAYLDARDRHHVSVRAIVAGADELAASALTLGESAVDAARAGRLPDWQRAITTLQVRPVALAADCAPALARLRAETELRMPDCCVLHAADEVHADAIGTRDTRLTKIARERGYETP